MRIPGRWWASSALLLVISGFCLPAARAQDSDRTAWLGVYTQSLTPELRDAMGHDGDGVLVNRVVSRSPADLAGVRKGDIIVRVNSESVNSPSELARSIQSQRSGDEVQLVLLRDGDRIRVTATLSTRSEENAVPRWTEDEKKFDDEKTFEDEKKFDDEKSFKEEKKYDEEKKVEKFEKFERKVSPHGESFEFEMPDMSNLPDSPLMVGPGRARLGVRIETLSPGLAEYFEVKGGRGVLVLDVVEGSSADKVGIRAGDVIVMVDDRDVLDTDDLVKAINESGDKADITVVRRGSRRSFTTELGEPSPRVMRLNRAPGAPGSRWRLEGMRGRLDAPDRAAYERELRELREELRQLKEDLKQLREENR